MGLNPSRYSVFMTPAVVVDKEVKSVGKVPNKEEVRAGCRSDSALFVRF